MGWVWGLGLELARWRTKGLTPALALALALALAPALAPALAVAPKASEMSCSV